MCPLASHSVSQSQEPSEAAAALPRALGKGVSSLLPLGFTCQVGSTPRAWGLFCPVLDGPAALLATSPFNFQGDFLPDQTSVRSL